MLFRSMAVAAALAFSVGTPIVAWGEPISEEAVAQPDPLVTVPDLGLSIDQIERVSRDAEQSPELDEEGRKQGVAACAAAVADLKLAGELLARTEAFARDSAGVAERVQVIKQELEEFKTKEPKVETSLSLADLEQAAAKAELLLTTRKADQAAAAAEPQNRSIRRKEIRARIAAIHERLPAIAAQQAAPPTVAGAALIAAKAVELKARRIVLEHEAPALESELAKFDAEDAADLVRLQSDLATRKTLYTERRLQGLREQIKTAREVAAQDAVRKARFESIVAVPALQAYAERNQQLAETTQEITQKLDQAELDRKSATEAYEQLSRSFKLDREKVELVGLTSSVGALLRKQRTTLPDVQQRRADIVTRRTVIDESQYQAFEYDDEREALADTDAVIAAILEQAEPKNEQAAAFLADSARELLDRKREYLDQLIRNHKQYFETLVDLDITDQRVIALTEKYGKFIDERVLWIRSGRELTHDFGFDPSDVWLISPSKWSEVGHLVLNDARTNTWLYVVFTALFGFLVFRGRRMRRQLSEAGEIAVRANCRTFEPTMRAVALTVLISIAWPGLVALAAWRVCTLAQSGDFAISVGLGLFSLCLLWQPLELFRQLCRPGGLAESHFAWPENVTQLLRRHLRWFTLLGLPFAFATATLYAGDAAHGRDTLERLCFIGGISMLAVLAFRVFGPNGLLREYMAYNSGGWIERLKYFWPWIVASVPFALIGLAYAGYYYTAQVLSWRLFATACFLVGLLVVRELLMRMLLLRRRNLSMQQARQRAAASSAPPVEVEAGGPGALAGILAGEPLSDLSAHNTQTRRLLSTGFFATSVVGLWLIWVQVLPALGMLDKYELWSTGVTPAVAAAPVGPMGPMAADKSTADPSVEVAGVQSVVTLSDLALAVLVVFVTFVLFRNGPGLLEMSLLQKLPLDASVRYAITTLVSYAIVMIGTIMACSTIGLRWSQVQWLATALTFGLAFGLQEMFANFVAGLIILLERPIRVGDVVTVDDITGVVSRIRIRATSITNWDRKEYVVPNKEFITGRLLNWTLSDKVNRVLVNVGVAYGTDTEKARKLLLEAANNHPLILKDPPAVASFEGFGDNSLNFVLRAYLPTLDNRLQVIHDLHTTINNSFNEERIEIAFPQRDLHIRTAPEVLAVALGRERDLLDEKAKEKPNDGSREAA